MPDDPDAICEAPAYHSLPDAVRAIARSDGINIDPDELLAVMGLSWSIPAVPHEPDPTHWPMYARDAFLIEAGRVYGLDIRPVHPPEAARGLDRTPEFAQHFEASYRPIIRRALEHHQPVLAWQGWPAPFQLCWGIIRDTCDEGLGFTGDVHVPIHGRRPAEPVHGTAPRRDAPKAGESNETKAAWTAGTSIGPQRVLVRRPPVQLYVVETINPPRAEPDATPDLALTHGRIVLENGLRDRFGVVTGAEAFGLWSERLSAVSPDCDQAALFRGFRVMAAAVCASFRSLDRCLARLAGARRIPPGLSGTLREWARASARALEQAVTVVPAKPPGGPLPDPLRISLEHCATAAAKMRDLLASRAR